MSEQYRYGFVTDIENESFEKGLNEGNGNISLFPMTTSILETPAIIRSVQLMP